MHKKTLSNISNNKPLIQNEINWPNKYGPARWTSVVEDSLEEWKTLLLIVVYYNSTKKLLFQVVTIKIKGHYSNHNFYNTFSWNKSETLSSPT